MPQKEKPGLRLFEEGDGRFRKYLVDDDGTVLFDEIVSPHDRLIDFMDKPMKVYYEKIRVLETHTLFREATAVSAEDFNDLINAAFAAAEGLRGDFPEAYYFTKTALTDALLTPDDGSASYLLHTGSRILTAVRLPYITKVRMRNIMEVCFGTTDGFTQEERYAKICELYPTLHEHTFSVRWISATENGWRREYVIRTLFELYVFELLAAYKKLRARFYERDYREYANERTQRNATYECFEDWMEVASAARIAYLAGEIGGKELLRRLNPDNEPLGLATEKENVPEPLPLSESWRELVTRDMNFDPDAHFENMLVLDLRADKPDWRNISAEERVAISKRGDVSLREKYGKEK